MLHEKVTEAIIGAAMTVLNTLKPGLDEKLYERALVIELTKRGQKLINKSRFRYTTMAWRSERLFLI